jgi:hypothetical protein
MPALALAPSEVDLRNWANTVTNGRRSSESCIMPPWNQRMNAEQIWNAVIYAASLRHDSSLLARGESLLADYQTGNSIGFLADTNWQADNADSDILTALNSNTLEGFDITDPLPEDDQQAMLVFIRAQAYSEAPSEVAQITPQPQSTEEAEVAPAATEEQPAPTPTPASAEPISVTGTVVNGTAGGSLPDELTLTLRVAGLDEEGAPFELYRESTEMSEDGRFVFENVPPESRALAVVEANYSGVRQLGPQIIPSTLAEEDFEMTFTIYETTNEPDAIVLTRTETWIDAVTAESASLILQSYAFRNTGDRIYIGDEGGRTLAIPLPAGTLNSAIDAIPNPAGRFLLEDEIYYDTEPVYPGDAGGIATSFDLSYDGSMEVTQTFPYPVMETAVYVSEPRGLELESEQLVPAQGGTLNNLSYRGFALSADGLPPGSGLNYRVFDGERTAAAPPVTTSAPARSDGGSPLQDNAGLILGIGVLLIIGGGMFLFYDLQKRRLELEIEQLPPTIVDEEDLIAAMAALDEAYEAGKIGDVPYQERRQALKDALRERIR